MVLPQQRNEKSSGQFSWGVRKGSVNLYESFTLDGIKYSLYDCVYLERTGQSDPDIGKLVNIWETEKHEKKVQILWFFRPNEIAHWLGDIKPLRREIFLACGQGKGLSNVNPLEAISGKCNVVCSSKHERNPQPTEEDLRMADHIFYRTFDVKKCMISEKFPSLIDGIEVKYLFNRRKDSKCSIVGEPKPNSKSPAKVTRNDQFDRVEKGFKFKMIPPKMNDSTKDRPCASAKSRNSEKFLPPDPSDVSPLKKRKLLGSLGPTDDALPSRDEKQLSLDERARKFAEKGVENKQHLSRRVGYKFTEVTRRPDTESSKWFKLEVWKEEQLRETNEKGKLVLLENFDPSFTSAEVEDIVWYVFEQRVKAKMIQLTALSSPHSGRAFAIFQTKEAADNVISKLTNGCLVLGDGRPIVGGRRQLPGNSCPSGGFVGHLSIDRTRSYRQREEKKNAVATSHFSQANTIEYELALQWYLHEAKSYLWWKNLHEDQGKEIEALMKKMKIHHCS